MTEKRKAELLQKIRDEFKGNDKDFDEMISKLERLDEKRGKAYLERLRRASRR